MAAGRYRWPTPFRKSQAHSLANSGWRAGESPARRGKAGGFGDNHADMNADSVEPAADSRPLPPLEAVRASRQRLERLSTLLDDALRVPGTRWRVGLDSIVGLVPVLGDVVGLAVSGFIVYEGIRIGAPRPLLLKMTAYAALDAVAGLVPVIGDLMDFAFKANRINARLLTDHLDAQERRHAPALPRRRWLALLPLLLLILIATAGSVALWRAI